MTVQELLEVQTSDQRGLGNCDLADDAAKAAATELAHNWVDAMRDGESLADLLGDIGDTVCALNAWRAALTEHVARTTCV